MKKKIFMFGFILGGLIFGTIGVIAAYKYQASEVGYTPSNSNFDVDNVSDAIKELYEKYENGNSSLPTDILEGIQKSKNYLPNGYYKSTAEDNNVIFGGYCWKIIRKNDDDDIRMIYNGTPNGDGECTSTGEETQIDISKFSISYDVTDYNNSTVKSVVDNWYNNLSTNYYDKITTIDLITREEASTIGGGYLASGKNYWTQTPTGNSTSSVGSCDYNICSGSGECIGSSNTIYIINESGILETNNNGTYSSCTVPSKSCNNSSGLGTCNKWMNKNAWYGGTCTSTSQNNRCGSEEIDPCPCCQWSGTDACSATPEGSSLGVRPVITLKNTVTLQGGQGTSSSPYYLN